MKNSGANKSKTIAVIKPVKSSKVDPLMKSGKTFLTKDMDDINAVKAILAGKTNAFASLYKKYYAQIHRKYSQSLKWNKDMADDLTMELFEKVLLNLKTYKPEYTFNSWITRVAHNYLVDFTRRKGIQTVSLTSGFESNDSSYEGAGQDFSLADESALSGEEIMVVDQRKAAIAKALSMLDERSRKIVEARFFGDMTYEEMVVELQIPLQTIKITLFRCKEKLKAILSADKTLMNACDLQIQ